MVSLWKFVFCTLGPQLGVEVEVLSQQFAGKFLSYLRSEKSLNKFSLMHQPRCLLLWQVYCCTEQQLATRRCLQNLWCFNGKQLDLTCCFPFV